VATAREIFANTDAKVLPVYDNWNGLSGFVEREVLHREARDTELVRPHYEAEFLTATTDANLLELTEAIVAADVYGAAIYRRGEVIGFVLTEDVITLLDRSPRRFYRRFTSRA
jgi:CBS-domain-containing membrane protein